MQRGVHGVSEDGGNDDEIGSTDAQFLEQNLMTSLAQFEHEVIGEQRKSSQVVRSLCPDPL